VVSDPPVFVGAGLVVAGAEIGEPGGGVGEQVPVALCGPSVRVGRVADFAGMPAGPAGWTAGPAEVMAC
jgi:hypothetical protein